MTELSGRKAVHQKLIPYTLGKNEHIFVIYKERNPLDMRKNSNVSAIITKSFKSHVITSRVVIKHDGKPTKQRK